MAFAAVWYVETSSDNFLLDCYGPQRQHRSRSKLLWAITYVETTRKGWLARDRLEATDVVVIVGRKSIWFGARPGIFFSADYVYGVSIASCSACVCVMSMILTLLCHEEYGKL
ncbi:unnamed protein product [Enterobius vermicularis]|uniref:Transmembrane protein n=1 Tax=Enterobius vermicularis TaxID=51028 RepID=A0A0N4UU23_ENTVE|nr:unnamed protein product [Enterobius vermicularis]